MSTENWLREGAEVTVIHRGGRIDRIVREKVKVTRIGLRDVLLEDGRRFRLVDLHEQGQDSLNADQIVAVNDPLVRQIKRQRETLSKIDAARQAVEGWERGDKEDQDRVLAAIAALAQLLPNGPQKQALLDQVGVL